MDEKNTLEELERELELEKEKMKDYEGECYNVSLMYCDWLNDCIERKKAG